VLQSSDECDAPRKFSFLLNCVVYFQGNRYSENKVPLVHCPSRDLAEVIFWSWSRRLFRFASQSWWESRVPSKVSRNQRSARRTIVSKLFLILEVSNSVGKLAVVAKFVLIFSLGVWTSFVRISAASRSSWPVMLQRSLQSKALFGNVCLSAASRECSFVQVTKQGSTEGYRQGEHV
jgi:hypothetical protein